MKKVVLQVQEDDQLGRNICQSCSENIMKFYEFVLTYRQSDRKLREMLNNSTVVVDELIEFKPNIVDLECQQRVNCPTDNEGTTDFIKVDVDSKELVPKTSIALVSDPGVASPNHHEPQTKQVSDKVPCNVCPDKFDEYECDICSKRFISKTKIRQHLITHINEGRRKFLCVACGNQFCSKFGLAQHISSIHDKEQKFQCTKCSRRFAHKHNLKTHMNRHDGIRPYACGVCSKSFYDSSTLNVHTKSVHSGTNAYVCSICSKGFNRNGNLKIHMVKTHHIQRPKLQTTSRIHRVIMKVE